MSVEVVSPGGCVGTVVALENLAAKTTCATISCGTFRHLDQLQTHLLKMLLVKLFIKIQLHLTSIML